MKKKVGCLLALCVIATFQIWAQNAKLNFTIYGGISSPQFSYEVNNTALSMPTIGNYNGYTFGMRFATIKNIGQSNWGFSGIGAIQYQQAGASFSNTGLSTIKEIQTRINYLEVNTMFGIGIGPKIPKWVEFQIGLAAGYALSGQAKTIYANGTDSTTTLKFGDSKANGKKYKDFNFGIKMGLSVSIAHFNIAAYYFSGLNSISNDDDISIKNKNFNITLGYSFNLMYQN